MVLVLPCGASHANIFSEAHCSKESVSRRRVTLSRTGRLNKKLSTLEHGTICDLCTSRSAMRCQSVTRTQTDPCTAATQTVASDASSSGQPSTSSRLLIRPVELSELEEVAWLRAEAYYEVCTRSKQKLLNSLRLKETPLLNLCCMTAGPTAPEICRLVQEAIQGAGGTLIEGKDTVQSWLQHARVRLLGGCPGRGRQRSCDGHSGR